jgi:DNA uptake protein ComE-like DNA-binding protein
MVWRDFFYFSKGERQALIVLLCLITATGAVLFLTRQPASAPETAAVSPVTQPEDTAAQSVAPPAQTSARSQAAPRAATKPRTAAKPRERETVSERMDRMASLNRRPRTEKLSAGMTLEMNAADTTALKKVPGIGSAFASRIVKYRNLLGGYHSVTQLREVYGIDEEKYAALSPWFTVDASQLRKLSVNTLPADSLRRHPYINYRQARAIERLRKQKKQLSGWENLQLLEEFTEEDGQRILPYLSFE